MVTVTKSKKSEQERTKFPTFRPQSIPHVSRLKRPFSLTHWITMNENVNGEMNTLAPEC